MADRAYLEARIYAIHMELQRRPGYAMYGIEYKTNKIIVHSLGRDVEIPRRSKNDIAALQKAHREMKALAYRLNLWEERKIPYWLPEDAKEFVLGATYSDLGIHGFGQEIRIDYNAACYPTNQFLIIIIPTRAHAFRYYPTNRNLYKASPYASVDLVYQAAMETNSNLYHYIEIDGLNPEHVTERLLQLKNEIVKALIYSIGWGPGEATWTTEFKTSLPTQHSIMKEGAGASELGKVKRTVRGGKVRFRF